jgi:2'-hydroxyisoflavone reductase
MKLLILGGTVFLGRHTVDAALARGHEVTIFTRGQHPAEFAGPVERLRGDRDGGLDALRGRRWDAAIDTSGYVPRVVGATAALLADAVAHYTFVSSISAYGDWEKEVGVDERHPLAALPDEGVEEVTGETYGALKALCERAVEAALPGRTAIVRPGLIVGPYDPTDRFTYWPHRVARGGALLAPGRPQRAVQFVDARDLGAWLVRLAEERRTGAYNATGPAAPLAMAALLDACREASGSDAAPVWVDDAFLMRQGVTPWSEVPLWAPEDQAPGLGAVSIARALAAGLTFRPHAATVRDTLAWDATRPADRAWQAGLTGAREAELLAAWSHEGSA